MREKREKSETANQEGVGDDDYNEFRLQADRIRKILHETNYKLKLLMHLPTLLEENGKILRQYLTESEVDYIVMVCQEGPTFSKQIIEDRPDLCLIYNMLERINMYGKTAKGTATMKKGKGFANLDLFDVHVAYVVDTLFKSKLLIEHIQTIEEEADVLITAFVDAMVKLMQIADDRLQITAQDEIKKENDLKMAYRSSMMLSDSIQELEDQLEKQRLELGKEIDHKEAILHNLAEKIKNLKEKAKTEVNQIVYDSELLMMKDYNKNVEKQEELASTAKKSIAQYEQLLEQHLEEEKILRAKRLKAEAQLASWVTKYDTDIGEKQAELDELQKTYDTEKSDFELLQQKFNEQEHEYVVLMHEKEEEEKRIHEEKAWIFLQNRAARRIQRYWRAYRIRKLARKKARKSKKKGEKSGSADTKKGKSKKKGETTTLKGGPDPNALLKDKINPELFADIQQQDAFGKKDVVVDLNN